MNLICLQIPKATFELLDPNSSDLCDITTELESGDDSSSSKRKGKTTDTTDTSAKGKLIVQ